MCLLTSPSQQSKEHEFPQLMPAIVLPFVSRGSPMTDRKLLFLSFFFFLSFPLFVECKGECELETNKEEINTSINMQHRKNQNKQ